MMRQVEKNEVVMCLNSPTLPFLPCFITFCSTHSYTSHFYEIFATCIYSLVPTCRPSQTYILKNFERAWERGYILLAISSFRQYSNYLDEENLQCIVMIHYNVLPPHMNTNLTMDFGILFETSLLHAWTLILMSQCSK